jgi:hypothetical protein
LLAGNGKGEFTSLKETESGLFIRGEVRYIEEVKLSSGKSIIIFALNNGMAKIYTLIDNN